METTPRGAPPRGTQTLERALAVVQEVADGAGSLTEIARRTGLNKSTVHRLLRGLVEQRLLSEDRGAFRLGPRLITWGDRALAQNGVVTVARPVLESLSASIRDTVHLAEEDHGSTFYLFKIDGSRGAQMRSRVGGREPLTRTGIGKALLLDSPLRWREQYVADAERGASAEEVAPADVEDFVRRMTEYRDAGTALDLEENEPGIRCVAAPVRDRGGRIVAAISVSATSPYMPLERMESLRRAMREAACRISSGLGG